ncbi:MAG: hypothetical protein EVJ48_01945 [Candidatus Acidulodesulfobacterium acidiphilum]|uniref:Uncharacterized protein n=1 Tax=Candidatus Acidulodesulfobacterium acidiphilum TaxID=2597224 RepID=A0A520XGF1_9DELT|nr:MAG: hypothetical protein EVJ48_01945 [Candidatus Acidulodesulfobacterium acidiphilum]
MVNTIIIILGIIMIGLGLIGRIKNYFAKKNGEMLHYYNSKVDYNKSPFNVDYSEDDDDHPFNSYNYDYSYVSRDSTEISSDDYI